MWAAFVEAAKTSDPDAADLRTYADADALRLIVSALYTNRDRGQVTRGEVATDPHITAVTPVEAPTEASILDCASDANWLKYKKDGGLVDNVPGGKHRTTATVKKINGIWKVSFFQIGEVGTCGS
jgi:hypothetical protein